MSVGLPAGAGPAPQPFSTGKDFMQQFLQLTVDGLTIGALYSVIALGYTLVYGVLQLINFAHSEVFMFGAFGGLFAARWLPGGGRLPDGLESRGVGAVRLGWGPLPRGAPTLLPPRSAHPPSP